MPTKTRFFLRRLPFLTLLLIPGIRPDANTLNGRLIVIDPGHGTINLEAQIVNSGKITRDGQPEHALTIAISQKVGDALQKEGARVVYTRTPYDYWRLGQDAAEDNKARALFANELQAEAYVSIHCDWTPRSTIHGVTTLYEVPESRRLAESIHREMVRHLKAKDRKVVRDNFTVLDHTRMPAVIVETGFMSHRSESRKLSNPAYQEKIAHAITDGLRRFFSE